MCFSANASFIASGGLFCAFSYQAITTKQITKPVVLSSIMILAFSIQQALEGIVWLAIQHKNTSLTQISGLGYSFFAYWFWPFYLPLLGLLNEYDINKRKIFTMFTIMGFIFGGYLFTPLLANNSWLDISIRNQCITYIPQLYFSNEWPNLHLFIYVLCCPLSLVFSSHKILQHLCFIVLTSLLIAKYFYLYSYVSIWCFFSAIISLMVLRLDAKLEFPSPKSNSYDLHCKVEPELE